MSERFLEDLVKIGTLAKTIKGTLKKSVPSSYGQATAYVQQTVKNAGYVCAFPTLVLPDKRVSNWTPLIRDLHQELEFKVCCTFDIGIQTPSGAIIDTAVTITKPLFDPVLQEYKRLYASVLKKLNTIYEESGTLHVNAITDTVHEIFKSTAFKLVYGSDAHFIEPFVLHAAAIPMSYPNEFCERSHTKGAPLAQGDVFTIQPHVFFQVDQEGELVPIVQEIRSTVSDSNIQKDAQRDIIDTVDNRLGKKARFNTSFSTQSVSFRHPSCYAMYIEETFVIKDSKIVQLT